MPLGIERMVELQDKLYAQDRLGPAADLSGDGRGRQRRRHQARDVGRQSAGLPGVFVQAAFAGGTRSRLPVAHHQARCRSADASASSTAPTTRKCWWSGCTRNCSSTEDCRPRWSQDIWDERFEDINAFERYLSRNGVVIRKFFLNLSKKEQKRRFLERLTSPTRTGNFRPPMSERERWDDYMTAYEEMIRTRRRACALVRRPRRQQMVHAAGGGRGDRPRNGRSESALSDRRCRQAQGA